MKLQMIQLLSNFPLLVVKLDDCYIAEIFRKELNSLAMHPKIPLFRSDKSLKYNHNLKESAKQQFFAPFQSYICSNNVHRYATSVKSNYRHDGDSHIAINFQEINHICNQNYNNIRIICSHVNIF